MWLNHPSHYEREQNAKRRYWRSPQDKRLAWLLFRQQDELRTEVTRHFYHGMGVEPGESLAEPERVQEFIDEEHADASFHPKYQGVYDNRFLELRDFESLLLYAEQEDAPAAARLDSRLKKLYSEELGSWATEYQRRIKDIALLETVSAASNVTDGEDFDFRGQLHPISDAADLLTEVQSQLEEDRGYLASFDRSVFTLHYHVAERLGRHKSLCRRYRIHIELEWLMQELWAQQGRVEAIIHKLASLKHIQWEELAEIEQVLLEVNQSVLAVYQRAANLFLPSLRHIEADAPLYQFLPEEPDVLELDVLEMGSVLRCVDEVHQQVMSVLEKLHRIHRKSWGGVVAFQEQLTQEWRKQIGASHEIADSAMDGETSGVDK